MQTVTTPLDMLIQLARSFGAKGQKFTDLTFSDEYVDAVEAVEADGGRYDRMAREGVESAFCDGRREWQLAGGWKTAWTTAPTGYDGFGTEMVEGPFEWEGKQLRRVLIEPEYLSWQTGRYGSGGHGDWDEDPRVIEARIRETLAREKIDIELGKARYAGGLFWLRETSDEFLETCERFEDKVDVDLSARGLTWKDLRTEQRRRRDEKATAERAAKWAACRATFKDGDTLIDVGVNGHQGYYGWISGIESRAHTRCKVKPHYSCENDASQARVVSDDDTQTSVGTLELVASWLVSGRMRVAGPEDVIPPRAVTDRLRISWKDVLRVDVNGRIVWIGRRFASSETLVLDDDGHIVRAKKLVDAAESIRRECHFNGLAKRSFRLFDCAHIQTRAVRFARDGVDPSALKVASVCVACGACRVSGERKWRDAGCLELNVGGPSDGYQESDRAELIADGAHP